MSTSVATIQSTFSKTRVSRRTAAIIAITLLLLVALLYRQLTVSPAASAAPREDTMCFASKFGLSCR
jgi:hypothetical protein